MKRTALVVFVMAILSVTTLMADHKGRGQGRFGDGVFVGGNQGIFLGGNQGLPPGLAKRGGNLPPGLQRHIERTGHLPPGLEKKLNSRPIFILRDDGFFERRSFVDRNGNGLDDRDEGRAFHRRLREERRIFQSDPRFQWRGRYYRYYRP